MAANIFALAARRDYTNVATGGSIVRRLLKPMNFEMKAGQVLLLRVRQHQMRELYERDWEEERLEFKRLKMNLQSEPGHFCCRPLPVYYRRVNN